MVISVVKFCWVGVWCSLWGFGMECDGLGEMCVEDDV